MEEDQLYGFECEDKAGLGNVHKKTPGSMWLPGVFL